MKSATEIESGIATRQAIAAAISLPNASGAMYETRPLPPEMSFGSAVMAGIASTTRKTATPARTARMSRAAPVAVPAKTLSPTRRVGVRTAIASRVSNSAALKGSPFRGLTGWHGPGSARALPGPESDASARGSAPRSDRVDGGLDLLAQLVADRRRAGVLGRGVLALRADDVAVERLDQLALVGRVVLRAGDLVGDERDRIRARDRAVELEREHVLAGVRALLGLVQDGGGSVGRRRDVLAADLDLGDAELAGLAVVGVADRALAVLDGVDYAGRALGGLAALDGPVAVGRIGPDLGRRLRHPVGEVGGRARLVRAVDRRDAQVGQLGA